MTSYDPDWRPAGPSDSSGDWGSAAAGVPEEADNPWSAASGDAGLGGATPPAQPDVQPTQPQPYVQPTQPYVQPTQPYVQPIQAQPTQPYVQPSATPYVHPPTGFPAYDPGPAATDSGPGAYGQPAYGQPGYGPSAPGYGPVNPYARYGQIPQQHPQAVLSLVFGIIGLFCGVFSIPATILGAKTRREVAAQPGQWIGGGMGTAGMVLGIIGMVVGMIYLVSIIAGIASS